MAIVLDLGMFDRLYHENSIEGVVVNDLDPNSKEDKLIIDNLIMRQDSGDTISLVPKCLCGELRGASYVGMECTACNTVAESPVDEEYNWNVWLRRPEGVAPLISPYFVQVLKERYSISTPNVNLIEYLTLHRYRLTDAEKRAKNYHRLERLDYLLKTEGKKRTGKEITRGYNSFVENFETIIDILEEFRYSKGGNKTIREEGYNFIKEYWCKATGDYIPIPNKNIFVMDRSHVGTYIDRDMVKAIAVVRRFTGIDITGQNQRQKEDKVAKGLYELGSFYQSYYKDIQFGKPGLIRKHLTRTRSHHTLRAVVTSRIEPHQYDEIEIPWSAATSFFREHLLKGLMQRGYPLRQALDYFMRHINKYSKTIDDIFKEIIRSAGPKGVPCTLIRNPSLHRGSMLMVWVAKVKTNINDPTMSVSWLLSNTYNMDLKKKIIVHYRREAIGLLP